MGKKYSNSIEVLDTVDYEDDGFFDGEMKGLTPIASFSFGANDEEQATPVINTPASINFNEAGAVMLFNQTVKSSQRGKTPAVDGELFTIKRCYQFRPSTVRKLNELRAKHPDVNVYLNTIIDEAISFYHSQVFGEKPN